MKEKTSLDMSYNGSSYPLMKIISFMCKPREPDRKVSWEVQFPQDSKRQLINIYPSLLFQCKQTQRRESKCDCKWDYTWPLSFKESKEDRKNNLVQFPRIRIIFIWNPTKRDNVYSFAAEKWLLKMPYLLKVLARQSKKVPIRSNHKKFILLKNRIPIVYLSWPIQCMDLHQNNVISFYIFMIIFIHPNPKSISYEFQIMSLT